MERTAQTTYDTHAAVRQLTDAGMPEPQAEAVVSQVALIFGLNLATKADVEKSQLATDAKLEALRGDLEKFRLATDAKLEEFRLATDAKFEALRGDLEKFRLATDAKLEEFRLATDVKFETLRTEIQASKDHTTKWVVGVGLGLAGLVVALLKFF